MHLSRTGDRRSFRDSNMAKLTSIFNPVAGALCLIFVACSQSNEGIAVGKVEERIIYGQDDRRENALSALPFAHELGASSPALVAARNIDERNPNDVRLVAPSLREAVNLCSDEAFAEQPTAADCGSSLIAADLILTAGHCIDSSACGDTRFVFDYQVDERGEARKITAERVYRCAEILARQEADIDYAIVRLDRPVLDRKPVPIRLGDTALSSGQRVFTIGYPTGLPQKVTAGAWVSDTRSGSIDYFTSNLDVFPGSSGGGVFTEAGELAGIVVRGPDGGYSQSPSETCFRADRVGETYSIQIEATYVQRATEDYCSRAPDSDLCRCGDRKCDPLRHETTSSCAVDCGVSCGDGACNGSESAASCYADCGVCGDGRCDAREVTDLSCCADCGCPDGFACHDAACVPQLGNLDTDDTVGSIDVALLEQALETRDRGEVPVRADVDCDGKLTRADLRALRGRVEGGRAPLPCQKPEQVGLGLRHTCVLVHGEVYCWGDDGSGQLGTGKRADSASAADATPVPLPGRIVQLAIGASYGCGLAETGAVICWGDNQFGQLGRSQPPGQRLMPVDLGQRAIQISSGDSHACALLADHSVSCWGDNAFGQLGAGPGARRGEPVHVRLPGRVEQLALGASHSCALFRNGEVRCWGAGRFGQLGLGNPRNIGDDEYPDSQPPVSIGGKARWLRAHWQQTCAMRDDGNLVCWGDNTFQQLGYAARQPVGDDEIPASLGPAPLGAGLKDIALGQLHSCGLYADGSVRCWGFGPNGQLGAGTVSPPPPPPPLPPSLPGGGSSSPAAPTAAGAVLPSSLPPVELGTRTASLFAGSQTSCVISSIGELLCWGANQMGQLGYPSRQNLGDDETPASAGSVPLFGEPSVPWSFVNPAHLQVWLESAPIDEAGRSRRLSGTALTFNVKNRGSSPLRDFHLLYSFSAAERRGMPITLRDLTSSRARASISRQPPSDEYVLDLDFSGSEVSAGRQLLRTESVELRFADGHGDWDDSNDYSASQRACGAWRTDRVQVVSTDGSVVYGYARTPQ